MTNKQNKKQDRSGKSYYKGKRQSPGKPSNNMKEGTSKDCGVKKYGDINDPNFYFTDETLKNQIATISFNQFTGVPFTMAKSNIAHKDITKSASSVMRILLNPSAGYTTGIGVQNSSNLAALSLYTKLSANNAKTSIYAPQDLTTLIYAVGQLIAISSHVARAFGVARLFNYRNRAYPSTIINASGINYDDLIENFADYRNRYNLLMVTASQIPIPANIPYFKKCSELYANLYLDMEGSAMAQTYLFTPASTWTMDETAAGGTKLVQNDILSTNTEVKTMNTILGVLQSMIEELLNSSTLNAIYSDVLRVADKEGMPLLTFATIPDDYVVVPTYNSEIRKWINNMTIVGRPLTTPVDAANHTNGNEVLPDPDNNGIKYKPQFAIGMDAQIHPIINFDTPNATVDDIIEATRLTAAYTVYLDPDTNASYTDVIALPDHYVVSCVVYEGLNPSASLNSFGLQFTLSSDPTVLLNAITTIAEFSNFDWGPTIYLVDGSYSLYDVIQDFNYYTLLDPDYVRRLQDAIYFGLLSIR